MSEHPAQNTHTDESLFLSMVFMLSTSAMQQLGQIPDPITQKIKVDLDGAQFTIDMLNMLKRKTAGNLTREEEQMLNQTLSALQLAYVEVSQNPPQISNTDTSKTQNQPEETKSKPPEDENKRRFHKSYGV
jgi:hypothetical protein